MVVVVYASNECQIWVYEMVLLLWHFDMLCVAFSFSFFFLSLSNKNWSMHTEFHHFAFSLSNQIIKGNDSIKSSIVTRTNTEHNKNSIHNIIRCIFRGKKAERLLRCCWLLGWVHIWGNAQAKIDIHNELAPMPIAKTPTQKYCVQKVVLQQITWYQIIIVDMFYFFRSFCHRWCCAICCSRRAHMKNAFEILCQITK